MINYQKGLPDNLHTSISELLIEALGDKLIPILGNGSKAKNLIESSINPDNCISAIENGKLIGFLAIQIDNKNFLEPQLKDFISIYGIAGIIKAFKLLIFEYSPDSGEIYVECIAVLNSFRSKGIGRNLFKELIKRAFDNNHRITLEVINSNKGAIHFYKTIGFKVIKNTKLWPFNKIAGWNFKEVIKMEKIL
ncbi:MAG: GNAT family N-acetyltransferase [Desulfobacterales bacterium]|nr:GNAT family N-acetyltransferase [Desulfobacterales bacterium]MCP4163446.1 GNAT family N-acetyltransferase [Deltaproteobacteria bacterium]